AEVVRGGVAQLRIDAGFCKLVKQCGELVRPVRVGELSNQVCRPYESWIICRGLVSARIGDGEAGAFNIGSDYLDVEVIVPVQALSHKTLATIHMIRG